MAKLPPWAAGQDVLFLFEQVKNKHHLPRLTEARIAVCFKDSDPFPKGRFNWGNVRRFGHVDKLWHKQGSEYDFMITICADAWNTVLNPIQREALVDLYLARCGVEYVPVFIEEEQLGKKKKGKPAPVKKKKVVDELGRVQYTEEIMRDEETGEVKWKVLPLDLHVFGGNVSRYGVWCEEILNFKEALSDIKEAPAKVYEEDEVVSESTDDADDKPEDDDTDESFAQGLAEAIKAQE